MDKICGVGTLPYATFVPTGLLREKIGIQLYFTGDLKGSV